MAPRLVAHIVSVLGVALFAASTIASAQTRPRTVLTIHWGAEDFPGTPVLNAAIREELQSRPDAPINYFAEYLESEAFPASFAALRDYIRQKYAGRHIDLVIANTTPSLRFVLQYRQELFPDVPVLFLAGSMPAEMSDHSVSKMTGVVSDVSFAETLALALQLHPGVRRVFVVADAPTEQEYRERVRAALTQFTGRVELVYINEPSVPGLLAAVRTIPADSLLLYTRFAPTGAESPTDTVEVARLIAQISPAPTYGTTALYLGTGVVGGVMRDSRETGVRLGEIARQILAGTRPEDIPVEKVRRVPTFDWRQVQRWGIDPARLPPEATVQFRTPSMWESHRMLIAGTVILMTVQLALIVGLLTQRARRQHAEHTIRKREATLRSSYERIRHLAGRLINAEEATRAEIARDLHDDLCQRLVSASIAASGLKGKKGQLQGAEAQQGLSELENDISMVFDGIRRMSHELHSSTLRLLGLVPALKSLCKEVQKRHHVKVSFKAEGDVRQLPPDVALCLYRIAQESLRNGVVHGRAQQLGVTLERSTDSLELTVSDDGCGFSLETVREAGGGLGLVSMEERAHLLGGEVHIATAPQVGTSVHVRVPARQPEPSPVVADDVPAVTLADKVSAAS
jgi:signal transduction histidine kinase